MKYIKTFEIINRIDMKKPYPTSKYELNDYVQLDRNNYDNLRDNKDLSANAKIIGVGEDNNLFYWICKLETGKILWAAEWWVLRRLAPIEIEKYELNSNINKFNI